MKRCWFSRCISWTEFCVTQTNITLTPRGVRLMEYTLSQNIRPDRSKAKQRSGVGKRTVFSLTDKQDEEVLGTSQCGEAGSGKRDLSARYF